MQEGAIFVCLLLSFFAILGIAYGIYSFVNQTVPEKPENKDVHVGESFYEME